VNNLLTERFKLVGALCPSVRDAGKRQKTQERHQGHRPPSSPRHCRLPNSTMEESQCRRKAWQSQAKFPCCQYTVLQAFWATGGDTAVPWCIPGRRCGLVSTKGTYKLPPLHSATSRSAKSLSQRNAAAQCAEVPDVGKGSTTAKGLYAIKGLPLVSCTHHKRTRRFPCLACAKCQDQKRCDTNRQGAGGFCGT